MKISFYSATSLVLIGAALLACEDHRNSPNAPFPERINFVAERQYPEGIAYSSQLARFLVTSIPQGKVGTVTTDGQYQDFLTDPAFIAAIGMKVAGGYVFVCNSDQGRSDRSSAATTRQTAELLVFDINTRQRVRRTILHELVPAADPNFANDVTIAPDGSAYVTDSFSPVVYRVTSAGAASVLVRDDARFAGSPMGLNGIAYHPNNYLIVANTGQGKLYKVDLANGNAVTEVSLPTSLPGDGLTFLNNDLYVVTGGNRVAQVRSTDNWQSATILNYDTDVYTGATTSVAVNNQIYTLNARIGETGNARDFSIQRFRP